MSGAISDTKITENGVILRKGKPEDLPSLIKLSKDLNYMSGGDYMPGLWLSWCKDPDWNLFLAEKDGEVVSATLLRRCGNSFTGVGGRTHPSIRGTGVFGELRWFGFAHVMDQRTACFYGLTPHIEFVQQQSGVTWNFDDLERRYQWLLPKNNISQINQAVYNLQKYLNIESPNLIRVNKMKMKEMLANDKIRLALFPSEHVHFGPAVYHAVYENSSVFCDDQCRTFVSCSQNNVNSLSTGSYFFCPVGTACYIDYYGEVKDVNEIARHILKHFQFIPEEHTKHGGRVFVMLSFSVKMALEKVKYLVRSVMKMPQEENIIQEVMLQKFNIDHKAFTANL